ncbi:MAG: hypothetical protein Q8N88_07300 [Nanoarchaeota archaeon]|nr:hypothetical protein [Nanoarchaeota archaeon]
MKKRYSEIIISNGAEAFRNILEKIKDEKEKSHRILIEHSLCQRAFFWNNDNKVVITPYPIESAFLKANSAILGYRNIKNISPRKINLSLCEALIKDKIAFKNLVAIIKANQNISITPYAITDEFLSFIYKLRELNLKFKVPELPKLNSLWTVEYLDSKSGFRETLYKIQVKNKNIKLPQGFICKDINEANQVGQWFLNNKRSCIFKSNFGESGWGLKILKKNHAETIEKLTNKESIWNNMLIIVEEYINPDINLGGGSPSIEVLIRKTGPKVTYICGQIVDDFGSFKGVSLGNDIFDAKTVVQLKRSGMIIGKEYWEMGYRGYFDIDAVISKDKKEIYLIETNTRRTGGTHVYDIARKIFGKKWEKESYLISNDQFCYGKKVLPLNVVFDKIKNLLYPIDGDKAGIIVTIADRHRPLFGFVIVGKNKNKCLKIYDKLIKLFQS